MPTGLIVLDMLDDFVAGKLANPASLPTVEPIGLLVDKARRSKDWFVIYANDSHLPGDFELDVFGEHAMRGTPGSEVVEALAPAAADVVVPKRYYSAFTQTDLDATCRTRGVERLVVVGQHTDCCCRHTAYDAFQRGIALTVVSDATSVFAPAWGDASSEVQRRSLDYLRMYYKADVTEAGQLL